MKLHVQETINKEVAHYADGMLEIWSKGGKIWVDYKDDPSKSYSFKMPDPIKNVVLGWFRLSRRLFRLDKCNVYPIGDKLMIIRQGKVYHYDPGTRTLDETLTLRNCRNIMHNAFALAPNGDIYFGEYGHNGERKSVPVYRSTDGAKSWSEVYTFPPGKIKHIHGCYYDPYSDRIWVCTGDFENENWLVVGNADFSDVEHIGNGQQTYRTCDLFFKEDKVHWMMDSPIDPSKHIIFDRASRTITEGITLKGPAWYFKELTDGYYLVTTAREKGESVYDDYAHVYISDDLENWTDAAQFKHDGWPLGYMKFATISFAAGPQSSDDFYMHFEAVKKYDGKSIRAKISNDKAVA